MLVDLAVATKVDSMYCVILTSIELEIPEELSSHWH